MNARKDDRIAVSVNEACRLSGLSRSYVYELMGDGTLRFCLIGRRRLIFVESLRELLAAREVI